LEEVDEGILSAMLALEIALILLLHFGQREDSMLTSSLKSNLLARVAKFAV
jgi:hypothetical protein